MKLTYARPETLGIPPQTIMRFIERCEEEVHSMYSFAIVKGGRIAAEGYYGPMDRDQLKMTHSLSKSVNSLAVGIAIGDGKLHFEDKMIDFFPEDIPEEYDERIGRITIKDLLRMAASSVASSSAITKVTENWRTFYFKSIPYEEPGTYFSYDTGAAYMLSCIVSKVMKKNSLEVLKKRVFSPMGIEQVEWLKDRDGNCTGGWGFYIKPADMIKLGSLILNYGKWDGKQLIPEWYMREALGKQIDTYQNPGTGWPYGYGYQFWRYPENSFGWFGAFGQLLVCNKEKDLYVVTTGGCNRDENKRFLTIITETLVAETLNDPIPLDDTEYEKLMKKIRELQLLYADGKENNDREKEFFEGKYRITGGDSELEEIGFERNEEDKIRINLVYCGSQIQFDAGYHKWITQDGLMLDEKLHQTHSFTYAWKNEKEIELIQYMCNTSYYRVWKIEFSREGLRGTIIQNMAIGGTTRHSFSGNK